MSGIHPSDVLALIEFQAKLKERKKKLVSRIFNTGTVQNLFSAGKFKTNHKMQKSTRYNLSCKLNNRSHLSVDQNAKNQGCFVKKTSTSMIKSFEEQVCSLENEDFFFRSSKN